MPPPLSLREIIRCREAYNSGMTRREFLKRLAQGLAVAWLAPGVLKARLPMPGQKAGEKPVSAEGAPRFWLEGQPGACASVDRPPLWPPDGP